MLSWRVNTLIWSCRPYAEALFACAMVIDVSPAMRMSLPA
jgi:hypothetical protein